MAKYLGYIYLTIKQGFTPWTNLLALPTLVVQRLSNINKKQVLNLMLHGFSWSLSRRNNIRRNLVGVLYYGDGCFFQCLEGKAQDIDNLLESLNRDTRHGELKILSRVPIDQLSFFNWDMKYVAVDNQVKSLLDKQGLRRFNPYQFSPELISQLIDIFCQMPEPISPDDVEQQAQLVDVNNQSQHSTLKPTLKIALSVIILIFILIGFWMFLN
jgi:hypothetical protein